MSDPKDMSKDAQHGAAHRQLPKAVSDGPAASYSSKPIKARSKKSKKPPTELMTECQKGDRLATAKLISLLESNDSKIAAEASAAVENLPRPKQVIGITGPPGAGKSTLIDYLVETLRQRNDRVAVLAIDPSSPFTGGALLGDRIRMKRHGGDEDVFIRSMGSRGAADGLATAAGDALRILGGSGFDFVLLETVGAGQSEIEIISLVDSVLVLQIPGTGDDVQLLKRGILEIADIFVVHKSDLPGADLVYQNIRDNLKDFPLESTRVFLQLGNEFSWAGNPWEPPVVSVSSIKPSGGEELVEALDKHRAFLQHPALSEALHRDRICREMVRRCGLIFNERLAKALKKDGKFASLVDDYLSKKSNIFSIVQKLTQVLP